MSNKTTFALYIGFVAAVAFLLLGYWKASTERLYLREELDEQAEKTHVDELKLANAADTLRKQLEEAAGQIETLNHEKGELEAKVKDGDMLKKEKESLKERFDAVNENLKTEKDKAETLDKDKKKLNDEVTALKTKVTNLSKTLNSTISKQETDVAKQKDAAGEPAKKEDEAKQGPEQKNAEGKVEEKEGEKPAA